MREMRALARIGSPRGRTARRTPKRKKARAKGRGRKKTAKITKGMAYRMIIVSRPSQPF
jgi:hypothetical protein